MGQLSKRSKTLKALGCLPAIHMAQQLKESLIICELGEAGSQDVTRVG